MTKKIEPSLAYLEALQQDLRAAQELFEKGKEALYRLTATAKLGQIEFEMARKTCLESNSRIEKLTVEITKVKKALQ